jgi:predicted dehydrogenase
MEQGYRLATMNTSIGIVGAGSIVANLHIPVLLNTPGIGISWITDVDFQRSRRLAKDFDVREVHLTDPPSDLPDADVVLLAIPYGARPAYYEVLCTRHCAVYAEKPFARTVAEHDGRCSAFSDWRIGCGLQLRSSGSVQLARQVLRDGLFGRLLSVRIGHGGQGHLQGTRYGDNLQLAGGGILFETGIHTIDSALFVMDARDVQVRGGLMLRMEGIDIHTEADATITTLYGEVPAALKVSGLEGTIQGSEFRFEHATMILSRSGSIRILPVNKSSSYSLSVEQMQATTPHQIAFRHWQGFLQSINQQTPNWTSALSCRVTTKIIEQLYSLPGREST